MIEGDSIFNTLRKFIRQDKEMCEALCKEELIKNASGYLCGGREKASESEEGERRRRWMGMDGMDGKMGLGEKTTLMQLLREVIEGGGEIEEREEVMRGIEGVISEGRERGDSEGMKAERKGAFLR